LVPACHGDAALRCKARRAHLTNRRENSPVDSFAIDYIIHSEAVPQNEPLEGGVPIMRISIVDSAPASGSAAALRSR
jgi:hypothetical protein